jgi:outer membrane protein assembly factor BamB
MLKTSRRKLSVALAKYSLMTIVSYGVIGCSSSKAPVPQIIPPIANMKKLDIPWDIKELSADTAGSFVPVLDDNAIFTADSNGDILRVDANDGTVITKFKLKRKLSSGTAVSGGSIFVTTTDGYLLSISKVTGQINWQTILPTLSIEAPQIGGDVVVVRTNDSQLSAYDAKKGTLLWVYQKSTPPLTLRSYNTFQVISRDVVIMGEPGGRLALINLYNGITLWEDSIAIPKGSTELDKLTDIGMRPVLSDRTIYVATYNGKIAGLNALNSSILWSKNISANLGILVDEENVYTISTDGILYAFDKGTGAKVWENKILQYRKLGVPAILGKNIIVPDHDGYINLFNRHDGKLVSRQKTNLEDGTAYPITDINRVIIQSGNGHIAKIIE